MKQLFKTNADKLSKVLTQLDYSQTMTYTQVILSQTNKEKLELAADKLREVIQILRTIQ